MLQVLTTLNQASDWHETKLYLIKMRYSSGSFHPLTAYSVDSFISLHSEFSDCSLLLTGALLPNVPCVSASVIMVSLQGQRRAGSLAPGAGSAERNRDRPCSFPSCLSRCFKKFILEFGKATGEHKWTDSSAQIAKQLVPI